VVTDTEVTPSSMPTVPTAAGESREREVVTEQQWGRVDDDGTVWVRAGEAERAVGSYPGATPEAALAYYQRKYAELEGQVALLEQRIAANQLSGSQAENAVRRLADTVPSANVVGDLAALTARLEALTPLAQARKAESEQAAREAKERAAAQRTALVEEAEALAAPDPERISWKVSGDRLRDLFEEWKTQQRQTRLDRHTEDDLWKRFSHARTTFDRKRRQHFGALDEQRSQARAVKERLIARAEELSTSTDWSATSNAYRDLMTEWKASGRTARKEDDALWARFRAAQDAFFAARTAANDEAESEFRGNLAAKEALLAEAERLLPVRDPQAARAALRDLQDRWDATGKVPRADLGRIEARLRAVEQAVRDAEQERWARSNPQARARAQDAVDQLESTIATLRKRLDSARDGGSERAVRDAEQALLAREEWLEQARKALADFGG
jgi:hypothetical protein